MKQAMLIYGELVGCYHNRNGYGGRTAEIYAYRLSPMTTMATAAMSQTNPTGMYFDALKEFSEENAKNLNEICQLFLKNFDATITVDEKPIVDGIDPFSYRVHVKVEKVD